MKLAKQLIVSGRVQGVGFRYFCQATAIESNLKGWVRNLSDGTVELHVEGDETDYASFKRALYDGNRFVGVEQIEETNSEDQSYRKFDIRY